MRTFSTIAVAAAAVTAVQAQSPSLCEKYTTALFKENTGENQLKLLTALVNTAVIGNYSEGAKNAVPGILNPNATYEGKPVNLVPYFSGALASSNRGGSMGVSVNFLDGGGATPLMKNEAPTMGSNENKLLAHLYQFFGALLGCSASGFPSYSGVNGQYNVHKYMALGNAEVQYFIQQVGLAAASFGVSTEDIGTVAKALNTTFGYRCSPEAEVIPGTGKQLQSICTADDCPQDPKANCAAYAAVVKPQNATMSGGSGSNSSTPAPSPSSGGSGGGSSSAPAPAASTSAMRNAAAGLSAGVAGFFAVGAAAVFAL